MLPTPFLPRRAALTMLESLHAPSRHTKFWVRIPRHWTRPTARCNAPKACRLVKQGFCGPEIREESCGGCNARVPRGGSHNGSCRRPCLPPAAGCEGPCSDGDSFEGSGQPRHEHNGGIHLCLPGSAARRCSWAHLHRRRADTVAACEWMPLSPELKLARVRPAIRRLQWMTRRDTSSRLSCTFTWWACSAGAQHAHGAGPIMLPPS